MRRPRGGMREAQWRLAPSGVLHGVFPGVFPAHDGVPVDILLWRPPISLAEHTGVAGRPSLGGRHTRAARGVFEVWQRRRIFTGIMNFKAAKPESAL